MLPSPFGLVDAQFLHHNAPFTEELSFLRYKKNAGCGGKTVSIPREVSRLMPPDANSNQVALP